MVNLAPKHLSDADVTKLSDIQAGDYLPVERNNVTNALDATLLSTLITLGPTYSDRAAAVAATVPDGQLNLTVATPSGRLLSYVYDATGTALTTNSGSKNWSPNGPAYPDHFAENTTPGTTDMTTAVQAWADWGGDLVAIGQEYACSDIEVTAKIHAVLPKTARFTRNSSASATSEVIKFSAGAENSVWDGGTIDGDRATHQAAYDVHHPSQPDYDGWRDVAVECARVKFHARILNSCAYPIVATGDDCDVDVWCENHGAAAFAGHKPYSASGFPARPSGNGGKRQRVRILSKAYDNNGSVISQHAVDVRGALNGEYSLYCFDADGDTSGSSAWLSGITMTQNEGCTFFARVRDHAGDTLKHVGVAFHGNIRSNLTPDIYNVGGTLLEANANNECSVRNACIDANYRATSAETAAQSVAVSAYRGDFNEYKSAKGFAGNNGLTFMGGYARRCGGGPIVRDDNSKFIGFKSYGHLADGFLLTDDAFDDYFVGATGLKAGTSKVLQSCEVFGNGKRGVANTDGITRLGIQGCTIYNNGQDTALSAAQRSGIYVENCDNAQIVENLIYDDQTWTVTDGVSFEPGTGTTHTVLVGTYDKICIGQWLTLTNALGPGDVTGKVIDMDTRDGITIEFSSSQTLSETGNTTALSGTWSGSGTSLTGSGGAASTEVTQQVYVTDGSEWRRVVSVSGNDALKINEAFTATLSGATLTIVEVDLAAVQSQSYGIYKAGSANSMMLRGNDVALGHTVSGYFLNDRDDLKAGSNYWLDESVTADGSDPLNIRTDDPEGHVIVGLNAKVTTALTGGTASTWRLEASSSTVSENLTETGISLALNTEVAGAVQGFKSSGGGDITFRVQFEGGTGCTAGVIRTVAQYEVRSFDSL